MGVISFLISYLIGSVPFGLIVGKVLSKIDVREHGSGNIGVSNVLRTIGLGPAIVVLIGDAGKGALGVWVGQRLTGDVNLALLSGLAAIIGHNWSVFLGFKGGRGVATTIGVLYAMVPQVALIVTAIWLITLVLSRYISLASIIAAISLPLLVFLQDFPLAYKITAAIMGVFVVYRHRPNIQRLLNGTEYKFGEKARKNN